MRTICPSRVAGEFGNTTKSPGRSPLNTAVHSLTGAAHTTSRDSMRPTPSRTSTTTRTVPARVPLSCATVCANTLSGAAISVRLVAPEFIPASMLCVAPPFAFPALLVAKECAASFALSVACAPCAALAAEVGAGALSKKIRTLANMSGTKPGGGFSSNTLACSVFFAMSACCTSRNTRPRTVCPGKESNCTCAC